MTSILTLPYLNLLSGSLFLSNFKSLSMFALIPIKKNQDSRGPMGVQFTLILKLPKSRLNRNWVNENPRLARS